MATLRGSKQASVDSIIKSIEMCISLPDDEIRKGLRGIINSLKSKKKTKQP